MSIQYSLTVTGENIIGAVPKMQNNSATIKLFIFAISKQQYWIYSIVPYEVITLNLLYFIFSISSFVFS